MSLLPKEEIVVTGKRKIACWAERAFETHAEALKVVGDIPGAFLTRETMSPFRTVVARRIKCPPDILALHPKAQERPIPE